jgi:hypothetical protein
MHPIFSDSLELLNVLFSCGIFCRVDDRQTLKLQGEYHEANGANIFHFLSSLPLLSPATTAMFGSYLSSLYS